MATMTDLFCGGGGETEAARQAGVDTLVALNHSPTAIATHRANHPDTAHHCVDISQTDPAAYLATDLLWASPACTFFSSAKQPSASAHHRDDDVALRSRATGFDMLRWLECWNHPVAVVENVPRWRSWPLFPTLLDGLDRLGYDHQVVYRNAALDGAACWRDRMFLVTWRKDVPAPNVDVEAPAVCPTHGEVTATQRFTSTFNTRQKTVRRRLQAGQRKQPLFDYGRYSHDWDLACPHCQTPCQPSLRPASTVLDTSQPAPDLDDRARPLRPATFARLRRGLARHGRPQDGERCDGDRRHLLVLNYAPLGRVWPANAAPLNTITGVDSHGLLSVDRLEPGPTSPDDVERLLASATYRMLHVAELQAAMGFPADYELVGTDRQRRIQIGMAVAPPTGTKLISQVVAPLTSASAAA